MPFTPAQTCQLAHPRLPVSLCR